MGTKNTLEIVRENFYWIPHTEDIKYWCRNSVICKMLYGPAWNNELQVSNKTSEACLKAWSSKSLAELCKTLYQMMRNRKIRTKVLHPQSYKMVERMNSTTEKYLAKMKYSRKTSTVIYRCSSWRIETKRQDISPRVLFGRAITLPPDLAFERKPDEEIVR